MYYIMSLSGGVSSAVAADLAISRCQCLRITLVAFAGYDGGFGCVD